MITVKFWNKNAWHDFETYGAAYEDDARVVAEKLAALFSAVEIHYQSPGETLLIELVKV